MKYYKVKNESNSIGLKLLWPSIVLFGLLLFILTWFGIQTSRSDSHELIRVQGTALIESLALSAENAIKANSFFDIIVQEKLSNLALTLDEISESEYDSPALADFAGRHNIEAIFVFDTEMNLIASGTGTIFVNLNWALGLVMDEVQDLQIDSSRQSSFQIIEGKVPGEAKISYLSTSADGQFTIALVADAAFFKNARREIGIGYLVRNIAREVGVEYIIFQTNEGIIFSSKKVDPLLKIEKDPFLINALGSDQVYSREIDYSDRKILELVKKFTSEEYGEGLFRVGITMDKYYAIIAGYDRQMITLSILIFVAVVLSILWLGGKRKRTSLKKSYRQIKSLSDQVFDSIRAGLALILPDGTIELANQQFLSIFEIGEEINGRLLADIPQLRVDPFMKNFPKQLTDADYELKLDTPSGSKHLIINYAGLNDDNNANSGRVVLVYDYTRLKNLEDDVRRKERLSELGDLAAGVAHEIRNPLNAISIAAQRLMAEFEPTENEELFQSFARQIKSEAGRLNDIVTRFLSLARSRENVVDICDLSYVTEDVVKLIRLDQKSADTMISTDIKPDITARLSENRYRQLLINLIKNGIEACAGKNDSVSVTLSRSENEITLSVADSGVGIPVEIKGKIFNPYYTTKESGTGLGLSIVHQIVEEFSGQIDVTNIKESGAIFTVKIPA